MNNYDSVKGWRIRKKYQLMEMKGNKCEICGYSKIEIQGAFHFHHIDPTQKDFEISSKNWKFSQLQEELKKCLLLCANCHAEIHAKTTLERQKKELEKSKLNLVKILPPSFCKTCSIQIDTGSTFCIEHFAYKRRKVERPTKEELAKLIEALPFTQIALNYGVSDNAIRKWAKKEGLDTKRKPKINGAPSLI